MNGRISDGFNRLDHELHDVRAEIRAFRSDARAEMNSRFDATQRLILQVGGGMFATMVVGFLGLLVSQH
ncbi:MAG TPA: hypothetical protein VH275_09165 [Solirubrobacterales bacterium]|jgi:hypothetical protein|nr:hypothetical protein [Solirubrobacterales bacterium]